MRAQDPIRRDPTFPILVPPGWRARTPPGAGSVVFAARAETLPASGVAPGLVLLQERVDDPEHWATARRARLRAGLVDADLEDEDYFEGEAGQVHYCRIGHRVDGREAVSEQWAWLVGGTAHLLTATSGLAEYLHHSDLFESIALAYDADLARASRLSQAG